MDFGNKSIVQHKNVKVFISMLSSWIICTLLK